MSSCLKVTKVSLSLSVDHTLLASEPLLGGQCACGLCLSVMDRPSAMRMRGPGSCKSRVTSIEHVSLDTVLCRSLDSRVNVRF